MTLFGGLLMKGTLISSKADNLKLPTFHFVGMTLMFYILIEVGLHGCLHLSKVRGCTQKTCLFLACFTHFPNSKET